MFAVPPNTIALATTPASAHPALIAMELAADTESWRHLLRFHTRSRFVTLVERTEAQEIWLMTWLPGQGTDPHNHGGATGAFTVVAGLLTEHVARGAGTEPATETRHRVTAGQSRVFGPGYLHRVSNDHPTPAVSIHVYRPARLPMITYRLDSGTPERVV
ncbi:MAG TPA: cysteine dioxygenase family protein [Actinophytocola sp.]|uniref:cysteine dioxygenase n=1 Tax=Actinophytocola sp. TaxID=1872138 RepID=UPI002DBED099|nr:cysteine dioxygenase family protein [Actinophytocola sp.]HEU5469047.1 cysteine dioxygenase family protein [Actinophytocola sp.]